MEPTQFVKNKHKANIEYDITMMITRCQCGEIMAHMNEQIQMWYLQDHNCKKRRKGIERPSTKR